MAWTMWNIQEPRFCELSDQSEAAETPMAEITDMKKYFINYARTCEVYVCYRKAGYSKKFLGEYEADILLHKAAKKVFDEIDEMGVKRLPVIKSFRAEYAALLSKKKKPYPEYSSIRQEMWKLQIARGNAARLMSYDEKEQEQKERTEKRTKKRIEKRIE